MDRAFASACVNCRNSPSMDAALPPEAAHSLKVRLGLGFASDWATGWKHSNATLQLSLHLLRRPLPSAMSVSRSPSARLVSVSGRTKELPQFRSACCLQESRRGLRGQCSVVNVVEQVDGDDAASPRLKGWLPCRFGARPRETPTIDSKMGHITTAQIDSTAAASITDWQEADLGAKRIHTTNYPRRRTPHS